MRERLQKNGFRWSRFQKLWYARRTEGRRLFARSIEANLVKEELTRREQANRDQPTRERSSPITSIEPAPTSPSEPEPPKGTAVLASGHMATETHETIRRDGTWYRWAVESAEANALIADVALYLGGSADAFAFDPSRIVEAAIEATASEDLRVLVDAVMSNETRAALERVLDTEDDDFALADRCRILMYRTRANRGIDGNSLTDVQAAASETARTATTRVAMRRGLSPYAGLIRDPEAPGLAEWKRPIFRAARDDKDRERLMQEAPVGATIAGWVKTGVGSGEGWKRGHAIVSSRELAVLVTPEVFARDCIESTRAAMRVGVSVTTDDSNTEVIDDDKRREMDQSGPTWTAEDLRSGDARTDVGGSGDRDDVPGRAGDGALDDRGRVVEDRGRGASGPGVLDNPSDRDGARGGAGGAGSDDDRGETRADVGGGTTQSVGPLTSKQESRARTYKQPYDTHVLEKIERWKAHVAEERDPRSLTLDDWAEFTLEAPDSTEVRVIFFPQFSGRFAYVGLYGKPSRALPTGFQALYPAVDDATVMSPVELVEGLVEEMWSRAAVARDERDRTPHRATREQRLKEVFHEAIAAEPLVEPGFVKPGAYVVKRDERDGKEYLYKREGDALVWVVIDGEPVARVKGIIELRDQLRGFLRAKRDGVESKHLMELRRSLEHSYDAFLERYGPISSSDNRTFYRTDPDAEFVMSLEAWDERTSRFVISGALLDEPTMSARDERVPTLDDLSTVSTKGIQDSVAVPGEHGGGRGDEPEAVALASQTPVAPMSVHPKRNVTPEARDFRMDEGTIAWLESSSKAKKFEANVEALTLLKTLHDEGRPATPDEQRVLARYTGWGQFPQLFDPRLEHHADWADKQILIESLLGGDTSDAYERARSSTLNAHYTHPDVARAISRAVERMGFSGGRILEPAVGTGNFLSTMPDSWRDKASTRIVGVELDPTTAAICSHLFPESRTRILATGFESAGLPRGYFDLAISNVPFGEYKIHDRSVSAEYGRDLRIHNYFFASAVEHVREGGLIAFVTSSGTLDASTSERFRRQLGHHADFLGAIRLPNTAFRRSAGTDVTTDVIFLQRRVEGALERHRAEWFRSVESNVYGKSGHKLWFNEYYRSHPSQMLGSLVEDTLRPGRVGLDGSAIDLAADLETAINALPESILKPMARAVLLDLDVVDTLPEAYAHVKDGGYVIEDTEAGACLLVRRGQTMVDAEAAPRTIERARGLLALRDAARALLAAERAFDDGEPQIDDLRAELGAVYERFHAKWGAIASRVNRSAIKGDPDWGLIASLEVVDDETGVLSKAPIFSGRVVSRPHRIARADSAQDALSIVQSESGRLDLERLAELLSITGEDASERVAERLQADGLIFRNPATTEWESADEYLAGDVVTKLDIAEAAARLESGYAANVDALRRVQPEAIPASDIGVRLGAGWIPEDVIEDFFVEVAEVRPHVRYIRPSAEWVVGAVPWSYRNIRNTEEFGTDDFPAHDLVRLSLNMKLPTVWKGEANNRRVDVVATEAAREKQRKIQAHFKQWIWGDDERIGRLERLYNERFNRVRLREFSDAAFDLPGLAASWRSASRSLRPHQYAAIRRIATGRNTLLAHVVGAGKTAEIIAGCMELKRLGLARKPMIVVPNHLVEQIGRDFRELYPAANILVQGQGDFSAERRGEFLGRIAVGTWDAIIVAHSSFGLIPVARDTETRFLREQIAEYQEALWQTTEKTDKRAVKNIEAARNRLAVRLARLLDRKQDDGVTFEELGVDQLFVDESHAFKNLAFATKLARIAGLSDSASERAEDMFVKCRHIESVRGEGRGVCFSTGTPLTNSIAEMYTLSRFLAGADLRRKGLAHFDAWVANFAETVTGWETGVTGKFQVRTRFSEFCNLPELLTDFRSYADVKTAEMLNLPRPTLGTGAAIPVVSPQSEVQKLVMLWVDDRVEAIHAKEVEPEEDNMLKVSTDCRKVSLDPRLVEPGLAGSPNSKAARAAEAIHHIWEATAEARATQLVFSDLGTPGDDKDFVLYEDIRRRLLDRGIPASEIAFIHDYDAQDRKLKLFDAVNAGKVRVLFGSSKKLGAGANVQRRLVAMHHLDVPWIPADIEQRNGRMMRQGNLCSTVYEFRYITQGDTERSGFDAYMWELVGRKARFIDQVMRGDSNIRRAEDVGARPLTYAEYSAIAHGNPLLLEKVRLEADIERLERLEDAWLSSSRRLRWEATQIPDLNKSQQRLLARLEADWAEIRGVVESKDFRMVIGGVEVEDRRTAGAMLVKASRSKEFRSEGYLEVGTYAGLPVSLVRYGREEGIGIRLEGVEVHQGQNRYEGRLSDSALGSMQSFLRAVSKMPEMIETTREEIATSARKLEEIAVVLERGFEHGEELSALRVRAEEIKSELGIGQDDDQSAMVSTDEEAATVITDPGCVTTKEPSMSLKERLRGVARDVEIACEKEWLIDPAELQRSVAPVVERDRRTVMAKDAATRDETVAKPEQRDDRPSLPESDAAKQEPTQSRTESEPGGVTLDELRAVREKIAASAERVRRVLTPDGEISTERREQREEAARGGDQQLGLF